MSSSLRSPKPVSRITVVELKMVNLMRVAKYKKLA
jgi:hypothetical protein